MKKLSASILSADFYHLGAEIEEALITGADWIHIDVMDGHFVPPITYGSKIVSDIRKHNNVFCDVHLMVTHPHEQIQQFIDAGAGLINFQIEATPHADRLINLIKDNRLMAGITINPATPIQQILHCLPLVDLVLVMSVNPGFGGQMFIDYSLDKVAELKKIRDKKQYHFLIEIDGGITMENAKAALESGVDVIVTGSHFFGVPSTEKEKFAALIHGSTSRI